MLQSIHNATKNWVGYVILFVMTIFLVGAFALWGVGDIFRGGSDTTVASVGSKTIDRADYDRELKSEIRQVTRGQTDLTMEQVRQLGLDKIVLDRIVERVAIDQRVAALGLTASDEAIRVRIQSDQAFQGTTGSFDRGTFTRLLEQASLTENEYVEGMRADIARQQYIVSAVAGVTAPMRYSRLLLDFITEQRIAEYVVLTPEAVGNPPEPTDAELAAYHKAHAAQFSTPEYREIQYVEIGVNEVASEIPVTEAELHAAWDKNKDQYQKAEQREVEQIGFPTEAAADAAYKRLQGGAPFMTVAHDAGKGDADVKLGTFPKSGLDARIAEPVFALTQDAVTAPVQGPFGWAILRVTKIVPGETKTFEQMHDQLRSDLLKERAAERIADIANRFEDKRAGDMPFPEAATAAGVTAQHAVIDNKGLAPDGNKAQIPAAPEFLQQAFATETGNESDMFEGADHTQYAVKVIGVRPPTLKPLDAVRAQVRERWIAERRAKMLSDRAQALTAQAQRESGVAGAAHAISRPAATSAALDRGKPNDVFSADALTKLFSSPPGTAIFARVGKGDGYVIARVTKVIHPPPQPAQVAGLRGEISGQIARDLGASLAQAARADAGIEIHQGTLKTVLGETQ